MADGTAETIFATAELVLGETAHSGIGMAERVHLAEEVGEAGWIGLANLLKRVLAEACGRERVAHIREGRVGIDDASGLREPSDELDPLDSARKPLSDEDGGTGAENAADLVRGAFEVWDVVNDKGEPRGVYRCVWQR